MHNPIVFKATFSGIIITAFDKPQVLKWRGEVTMYQARDSPELWRATPVLTKGSDPIEAPDPTTLARILEERFLVRETRWIEHEQPRPSLLPKPAKKAIPIALNRRA